MPVLYARLSDETLAYVRQQADESGLPIARVTEALLEQCRRRGWRVTRPVIAQVEEPT